MKNYGDCRRIEAELKLILEGSADITEEMQASLARYACVLASAYLEAALRDLVTSYTRSRASPEVLRYVGSTLGSFQNPNAEKILKLVGRFEPNFRRDLESLMDGRQKDSIDSICANRNSIAHGRQSGISIARIKSYYKDARRFLQITEKVLSAS